MLHFFSAPPTLFNFRMDLMNKVNHIDEKFSYLTDDNKVSFFKVTQDFMTMKIISPYQPQLLIF